MYSIRIDSTDNMARVQAPAGNGNGLVATRNFPSEDGSRYNRISRGCIRTDGRSGNLARPDTAQRRRTPPARYQNEGRDESIPLKNHQWNHVVWEIAPL